MTTVPTAGDEERLVAALREACNGHPHAKIAWPHRILHEAADLITRLRQERDEARKRAAYWPQACQTIAVLLELPEPEEGFAGVVRDRLSASNAEAERLREALKQARRTMHNCAGAIQSGQVVDKEVDRNLRRGYEAIDAYFETAGRAALESQQ